MMGDNKKPTALVGVACGKARGVTNLHNERGNNILGQRPSQNKSYCQGRAQS
jgi:hypothetical protein